MSQDPLQATPPLSEPIDIRAKPPSPRRLSRRVLLAGALCFGAIIAAALLIGLSDRPSRFHQAEERAPNAQSATPETLRALPGRYGVAQLDNAAPEASRDMLWGDRGPSEDLALPADSAWREPDRAPTRPAPTPAEAPPSPILYRRAAEPANAGASEGGRGSGEQYIAAPSQFLIQAGAVLPAALVNGLNSDLPGSVIAQITAPVYDSVTGRHLLVPQGARLIGSYRSRPSHGERRLFLSWDRLIMPNGASIALGEMEATDVAGASGLQDEVDHHLGATSGAILLSALMSVLANEAEEESDTRVRPSLGDAAAQQAAQTGARIVDRELDVGPTLRVRPGAPVRVLVTRDLLLRPYPQ